MTSDSGKRSLHVWSMSLYSSININSSEKQNSARPGFVGLYDEAPAIDGSEIKTRETESPTDRETQIAKSNAGTDLS